MNYIVAGGGLAGLTAAIELGMRGHAVTVCEQSKTLGGRAATHHQQGYAMNIGPHGFYRAGVMKQQFDAWKIPIRGKAPVGKGQTFLIANGMRYRFPANAAGLFRTKAFSFADKLRVGQVFARLGKNAAEGACPGESMEAWIQRQAAGLRVAQMVEALIRLTTYAADLDLLDARSALHQVQLALSQSVLYIDGGWETVVAGLAEKARSVGVVINSESGVIRVGPGLIETRDGKRLAADGIILAMPPAAVEQVTGQKLPQMVSARAACLDLGLKRLPAKAGTFGLGLDEPTYVSVHSEYAAGLAPAGGALVQLAMYLKRGASCTREELEQRADLILPGWREQAEFARFLPDMTVVHAIPVAGRPRPDIDVLRMPGVTVAGDWVGPEAMLADAAVASGLRAARHLAEVAVGKAA